MQGYKLETGEYKKDKLSSDQIWGTFNWLFSSLSQNDTSYKFIFLKSIIDCIDMKDANGRLSFDVLFSRFTYISWNLVLKYGLCQKGKASDGRVSSLEKVIKTKYSDPIAYEELFDEDRKKICHEIKMACKKYVVGALYGDTDGYIYSFSKKEEWILLNPVIEEFIKKNRALLENLNYFKWAKFYESTNGSEKGEELRKNHMIDNIRNDESVYRAILASEFETSKNEHCRINSLELLFKAEEIEKIDTVEENVVAEEVLYRDLADMKKYMSDPILLLERIKKEKKIM